MNVTREITTKVTINNADNENGDVFLNWKSENAFFLIEQGKDIIEVDKSIIPHLLAAITSIQEMESEASQ